MYSVLRSHLIRYLQFVQEARSCDGEPDWDFRSASSELDEQGSVSRRGAFRLGLETLAVACARLRESEPRANLLPNPCQEAEPLQETALDGFKAGSIYVGSETCRSPLQFSLGSDVRSVYLELVCF